MSVRCPTLPSPAKMMRSDFGVKTLIPIVRDETILHISAAFDKTR
jgi:hypothetical protein